MITLESPVDLVNIRLVYDGAANRKRPPYGNYLGCYGIPPQGGRYWVAANGDHGEAADAMECCRELKKAWGR